MSSSTEDETVDEPFDPSAAVGVLRRQMGAGYLGLQAVLGIVLWVLIGENESFRELFELVPEEREVMSSFVLADLGLVVVGSALAAWGIWDDRPWATPAVAFTTGAVLYPTFFLLVWVPLTGVATVALAHMVTVSGLTIWVLVATWRVPD